MKFQNDMYNVGNICFIILYLIFMFKRQNIENIFKGLKNKLSFLIDYWKICYLGYYY